MRLSPSQIKTFRSSKAKRVGKHIFGVEDEAFAEDSLALGTLFENYLFTGKDQYEMLQGRAIDDMEGLIQKYDTLKHNSIGLEMPIGDTQVKVEGMIHNVSFVGYLDNLESNTPRDVKTAQYLTKPDSTTKNMRSGMTTYEEYELQLWIYMILGNYPIGKIAEISKHKYKEEDRHEHQIITFEITEERNKKMSDIYYPIIDEMASLYNKFSQK